MARSNKRLHAEPNVRAELQRRSCSTTIGMRDNERANIILLRIEGLGLEAVAGCSGLAPMPDTLGGWSRSSSPAAIERACSDLGFITLLIRRAVPLRSSQASKTFPP